MSISIKSAKIFLVFQLLSVLSLPMTSALHIAYGRNAPDAPVFPRGLSADVTPITDATLDVSCTGIVMWQGGVSYVGGQQVIFNDRLYTAKWWSYNAIPGSVTGAWLDNGACLSGTTPPATCDVLPAWQTTIAYYPGQQVIFGGDIWTARWWTYNDIPGGPTGVWTDSGACPASTTTGTATSTPTTTAGP